MEQGGFVFQQSPHLLSKHGIIKLLELLESQAPQAFRLTKRAPFGPMNLPLVTNKKNIIEYIYIYIYNKQQLNTCVYIVYNILIIIIINNIL